MIRNNVNSIVLAFAAMLNLGLFATGMRADESPQTNNTSTTLPVAQTDAELASQLVGSWRIIAASRDQVPSQLHYSCITIKHITPTQFTWLSYKPDDRKIFRSMGGSWKVLDGRYIETPRYGTAESFRENSFGRTVSIECELDGDVFTQVISSSDGSKFIEVWQRMKPGEDADEIPTLN